MFGDVIGEVVVFEEIVECECGCGEIGGYVNVCFGKLVDYFVE